MERFVVDGQHVIAEGEVWIEDDRFLGLFDGLFILAEDGVNDPGHQSVRVPLAGVGLGPQLARLTRPLEVSRHT